jgi:hypothetical protein
MQWLSRFTGNKDATTSVKVAGKAIEVHCSASATKALAQRDRPLVAEIELAFACFARKQVRFHETADGKDAIGVTDKLALVITTIIPDACEPSAGGKDGGTVALRKFMPKWLRIDYVKGKWAGEYGL